MAIGIDENATDITKTRRDTGGVPPAEPPFGSAGSVVSRDEDGKALVRPSTHYSPHIRYTSEPSTFEGLRTFTPKDVTDIVSSMVGERPLAPYSVGPFAISSIVHPNIGVSGSNLDLISVDITGILIIPMVDASGNVTMVDLSDRVSKVIHTYGRLRQTTWDYTLYVGLVLGLRGGSEVDVVVSAKPMFFHHQLFVVMGSAGPGFNNILNVFDLRGSPTRYNFLAEPVVIPVVGTGTEAVVNAYIEYLALRESVSIYEAPVITLRLTSNVTTSSEGWPSFIFDFQQVAVSPGRTTVLDLAGYTLNITRNGTIINDVNGTFTVSSGIFSIINGTYRAAGREYRLILSMPNSHFISAGPGSLVSFFNVDYRIYDSGISTGELLTQAIVTELRDYVAPESHVEWFEEGVNMYMETCSVGTAAMNGSALFGNEAIQMVLRVIDGTDVVRRNDSSASKFSARKGRSMRLVNVTRTNNLWDIAF